MGTCVLQNHPAGRPLHIPLCLSTSPPTEAPLTFHLPRDSSAAPSDAELVAGGIRGKHTVTSAELSLRTVLAPAGSGSSPGVLAKPPCPAHPAGGGRELSLGEGVRVGIWGEWSPEASPTAGGGELNLSSAVMCCEQTNKTKQTLNPKSSVRVKVLTIFSQMPERVEKSVFSIVAFLICHIGVIMHNWVVERIK